MMTQGTGTAASNGRAGTIFPMVDDDLGLLGYLAIDSSVNSCSCGGVRLTPDISPSEVRELAHLMTLKYGFLGLPIGGAKAGLIGDPEMERSDKEHLLRTFGRALRPFVRQGHYIPGSDMGVSSQDLSFILAGAGLAAPYGGEGDRSAMYTGVSVAVAAREAAALKGMEVTGLSVAVEGFGKVGSSVSLEFHKMGARIVAISTARGAACNKNGFDVTRLMELYRRAGSEMVSLLPPGERIEKADLFDVKADILSPCAGSSSITPDKADKVNASIVSPGANLPVTREAEQILFQRGVVCIPDFVANCGGVLGASMEAVGLEESFIRELIRAKLSRKVKQVLEMSYQENIAPGALARRAALRRFAATKARSERSRVLTRMWSIAPYLHQRKLVPVTVVRPLSRRYFERRVLS